MIEKKIAIFADPGGGVYGHSCRPARKVKTNHLHEIHTISWQGDSAKGEGAVENLKSVSHVVQLIPGLDNELQLVSDICSIPEKTRLDLFVPNYRATTFPAVARL